MKMTIGERTITAEIQKREEARRAYEQAREQGKSASLLEQQRPNVFQMNVANILPGDEIRTELRYTELLTPSAGTYQFVYPTVVGPRYSNQPAAAPASEQWVANPYLHEGRKPTYSFDLVTHLSAGLPIQELTCTSHQVDVSYEDSTRAGVRLARGEQSAGNRDFILNYRLAGKAIESGLLLYEGPQENFFLLMVQPPKRFSPNEIPPREYIFIVDVSGSMHGFPLEISKRLLRDLLASLRPGDTFNVLLFAGGSSLLAPESLPANAQNVQLAVDLISRQQGGGGTELLPALKRALALPQREGTARTVVIATDGYVTVETEAFDVIRKGIGNANFFTFGIGSSVNRFIIEGMARAGLGEPFVVSKPDEAPAKAEEFRKVIQSPLLTRIKLNLDRFDAYELEPSGIPDVFAERPVVVCGKWRGRPQGRITLTGFSGAGNYAKTIDVSSARPTADHAALRYLWARTRIAQLADTNQLKADDERTSRITQLGLQYNLLTAYTSFVAIDNLVRNMGGEVTTIKQPLPLPQGVSDYAVGAAGPVPMMSRAQTKSESGLLLGKSAAPEALREEASASKDEADSKTAGENVEKKGDGAKVRIGQIKVEGALAEKIVRQEIERYLVEMEHCRGKKAEQDTRREVVFSWVIDASGRVRDIKVVSRSTDDGSLEKCLLRKIKSWRFSAVAGNGRTTVEVTLVFGSFTQPSAPLSKLTCRHRVVLAYHGPHDARSGSGKPLSSVEIMPSLM
jgi:Ca-activated chloride channel family protein